MFNSPLAHVIRTKGDAVGRLKGSLLCVAQDGTIAALDIDGFQLYVQPRPHLPYGLRSRYSRYRVACISFPHP